MTDISRLQVQLQVTKLQNKDNPLYQLLHELIGALKDTSNEVKTLSGSSSTSSITNNITNNSYSMQSGSGNIGNSSGLSATSMNLIVNNNSVVNNIANNMQLLSGINSSLGGLGAISLSFLSTAVQSSGSGTVTGSGTTGKLPKWASASSLTDSIISELAGSIAITASAGLGMALNGTGANGTYFQIQRAGVAKTYLGSSILISGSSNDDTDLYASGALRLVSASGNVTIDGSSGNVALKNVANTFTVGTQTLDTASAASNAFVWKVAGVVVGFVGSSGYFKGTAATDLCVGAESGKSLLFMTGGSAAERMILDTAGTLTIKADSYGLKIDGTATAAFGGLTLGYSGTAYGYVLADATSFSFESTNVIRFRTGSTLRFGINAAGDWLKGSNIMHSIGTPTIASGFGAGATIVGTDYGFIINAGTGWASGIVNFGHTWTNIPICVVQPNNAGLGGGVYAADRFVAIPSTTQVTIVPINKLTTNDDIQVICIGY